MGQYGQVSRTNRQAATGDCTADGDGDGEAKIFSVMG